MTIEERYLKSADRGGFQYDVSDTDDSTGKYYQSHVCIKANILEILEMMETTLK